MGIFKSSLFNVILLGVAFLFLFLAFQTSSMIEQTVLDAAALEPNSTFHGSGYVSLAIIYSTFALANWVAPFVVVFIGCKLSMFFSGAVYALFIASFIKPMEWSLYLGSAILGVAAAFLWTAQGNYISSLSEKDNVGRNSGIFWAIFQMSMLVGNLYQYFAFRGQSDITASVRIQFYIVLTICAAIGVGLFLLLKSQRGTGNRFDGETSMESNWESSGRVNENDGLVGVDSSSKFTSACDAFKHSFELICTREMLLLMVTFLYSGIELTFYSGVYGTCVGHTQQFGADAKGYIGLIGIMIGIGEILGGVSFSYFSKDGSVVGRSGVVVFGMIVHFVAFCLVFIFLPNDSPLAATDGQTYVTPSLTLALICGFLLGLGDSAFNTQLITILGYMYTDSSTPSAFAIFKFSQSLAAACAFYYSSYVLLPYQLLILVITGFFGTLSFLYVDKIGAQRAEYSP